MEKQINANIGRKTSIIQRGVSFLKWLGISIAALIVIGFTYQQIQTKVTADKYPPVGEIIDIGDYKLHLYALGKSGKRPTVILESGLGTPSSYKDWEQIQSELSKYTRVISYDRAGYGWSESASNDRTAEQIADDLHALLKEAGEEGPYLLVGHSFGGFTSQVFAHKYKEDVAGLVLIDSSHVDQEGGFSKVESYLIRGLKEIGVGRVLGWINMLPIYEPFTKDELSVHFFHQHFYNANQISEMEYMMTESAEQVRAAQASGFGDMPLSVLSVEHEDYPEWSSLQQQITSLSSNSQHTVVKDASHYIHLDQPEIVVETIMEMLESQNE